MSLVRIAHTVAVAAIGGVLALSAYAAQADGAVSPATHAHHAAAHAAHHPAAHAVRDTKFVAPAPHKYRADGMRMGLHCETHDPS